MAEPTPRIAAAAEVPWIVGQPKHEYVAAVVAALDAYDATHLDEVPWLEWGGGRGYDLFRVRVRPETGAEQ